MILVSPKINESEIERVLLSEGWQKTGGPPSAVTFQNGTYEVNSYGEPMSGGDGHRLVFHAQAGTSASAEELKRLAAAPGREFDADPIVSEASQSCH